MREVLERSGTVSWMMLVVKERKGDLLLNRFFLVTSLPWTENSVTRRWRIIANAARPRATWAG